MPNVEPRSVEPSDVLSATPANPQPRQPAAVEVLTHLQGRRSMARRMVFLDAAMDRFGGPEGFAQAAHRVFEVTRDARNQLKCLKTVVDIARPNNDRQTCE
ncbi:MAG: hypothetical protein O3B13_04295 [Planctomycetota bacterium]|nr:hypothetical protein [Planctomycetota bacterium]